MSTKAFIGRVVLIVSAFVVQELIPVLREQGTWDGFVAGTTVTIITFWPEIWHKHKETAQ